MAVDPQARGLRVLDGGGATGRAAAGAPHLRLVPPPPGGPPPPGLQAMRSLGRMSIYLVPAAVLVAQAWANERGISQAATNWDAMGRSLDDGIKSLIPDLKQELRKNWQGRDQEAAEAAMTRLSGEIGKLRQVLSSIGSVTDEIGSIVRGFWADMLFVGSTLAGTLVALQVLKLFPHTRAIAMLREMMAGKLALSTSALMLGQLTVMLGLAAKALLNEAKKARQLQVVWPSGAVAIDLTQARIRTGGLPPFQRPLVAGELPPGHQNYEWVAPKRELPTTPS
ncbi:WXG100 family type VII secretion target [Nonomuraea indica]|uniref:WXG100 family type VII secretion target n=1 Tax=Nonomuraea indica TaxID=1581193 RepID=A0ABW8A3X2_9ACTN